MSIVTSESLADMGYVVNSNGADPYSLATAAPALVAQMRAQAIPLRDDVWRQTIYVVERNGKITAVIRR